MQINKIMVIIKNSKNSNSRTEMLICCILILKEFLNIITIKSRKLENYINNKINKWIPINWGISK